MTHSLDFEDNADSAIEEEDAFSGESWTILLLGFAVALLIRSMDFLLVVVNHLGTVIHELGHAVVGFLFGYPSLPAMDFRYGGGVTMMQSRSLILVVGVYALLVLAMFLLRGNPRGLVCMASLTGLYALSAHSFLHRQLVLFAGHGTELLLGAVFVQRALRPGLEVRYVERPLYAACGLTLIVGNALFAWALMTDAAARVRYGAAKGGGHWMDFSRMAAGLGVDLETVAAFFFLCCLAAPILGVLVARFQRDLSDGLHDLLVLDDPPFSRT